METAARALWRVDVSYAKAFDEGGTCPVGDPELVSVGELTEEPEVDDPEVV